MLEKIYINESKHTDLNMNRCGIEDCSPGHSWGPAVRDHFIVHLILSGRGVYQVNGRTYRLEENDGFLICPNTVIYYEADADEPWSYSWVGFHGVQAEALLKQANLNIDNPVFKYAGDHYLRECLNNMIASKSLGRGKEIRLLGHLYLFLSRLIETAGPHKGTAVGSRREAYIKRAVEYIAANYHRRLTVSELTRHVGLDRTYLYSLFKEYLNMSPQDFLIGYRMDRACELLQNDGLTVGDISRSVGYEDPLVFSKAFKKAKGVSPRNYRISL